MKTKTQPTNDGLSTRPTFVRNNWRFPRRKERREEAASRQDFYNSLDLSTKISRAEGRRGESKKELAKLREQL